MANYYYREHTWWQNFTIKYFLGVKEEIIAFECKSLATKKGLGGKSLATEKGLGSKPLATEKGLSGKPLATEKDLGSKGFLLCT